MIFYAVCPDLIEPAVSRCATSVRTCIFIDKETAAQFFPDEFCEIFIFNFAKYAVTSKILQLTFII